MDCSASSDASGGASGTLDFALDHYNAGDIISFACSRGASTAYTIMVPRILYHNIVVNPHFQ